MRRSRGGAIASWVLCGFFLVCGSRVSASDAASVGASHEEFACGPACYAIVLRLLDRPVRNFELESLAGADGTTSIESLREIARRHGLYAEGVSLSPSELIDLNLPAILHMQVPDLGETAPREHFVVFARSASRTEVVLLDPLPGSPFHGQVDAEAALQFWTGKAVIISPEPFPFSITPEWWLSRVSQALMWWGVAPAILLVGPWSIAKAARRGKTKQ